MISVAPRNLQTSQEFPFEDHFTPEQRLIICCARVDLIGGDLSILRSLAGGKIDWLYVLRETLRQCLVPLLYRHLHAYCPDLVPAPILTELRRHYLLASARSLALAAELREITKLLEAANVTSLPYKGPILALQAYGDIALRTFTDLDLIVRPDDVSKAKHLLASRGYKSIDGLTNAQEAATLRFDHNIPLLRSEDRIVVELHWRVAPSAVSFTMPMRLLWNRSVPVVLGDKTLRGMSPSDLILVLSVHGTRHAWSAVEWITGIAELIRQPNEVCWDQVMREAQEFRVARTVRLGIALANRLLEAPIPDRVASWIDQDPRVPGLMGTVVRRLFVPIDSDKSSEQWAAFKFELSVKDGTREQVRDGLYRLFFPTSKDWTAVRLPDLLFLLYYVVRPFRLLGRYIFRSRT